MAGRSAEDVTDLSGVASGDAGEEPVRLSSPDQDIILYIGDVPTREDIRGFIVSDKADASDLAAQLEHVREVSERVDRIGERLQVDINELLNIVDQMTASGTTQAALQSGSQLTDRDEEILEEIGVPQLKSRKTTARSAIQAGVRLADLVSQSWSVKEVAQLLGVSEGRIRQRLQERSMYGFTGQRGWLVPKFQFAGRDVVPGFAKVVPALASNLNPLSVEGFFVRENVNLQIDAKPTSALEWLMAGGDPGVVAELARDLDFAL